MARFRNVQWEVATAENDKFSAANSTEAALAVLMDIREELQRLNRVMLCSNVARGFQALAKIASRDERAFKRRVADAAAKRVKRSNR